MRVKSNNLYLKVTASQKVLGDLVALLPFSLKVMLDP